MKVVYLSGGVGGARLLEGMARVLAPEALTAIVNVGDDFEHLGLYVCPDLDTVLYTLAHLSDMKRGWGLRGETFRALELLKRYGGEDWFQLGDKDLALHVMRSAWRAQGERLTSIAARLARALEVTCAVLPMSDEPVRTLIETERDGVLGFQDWLVRRRGEPRVAGVRFAGMESARATPEACAALDAADLIVIGPSNPYVSVDPILALPSVRERLRVKPVLAVSPIVGGRAIKGPLAEMIPTLAGRPPSAGAIAAHYGELLSGMVVERGDEGSVERVPVFATDTVMRGARERKALAAAVLAFGERLRR